MIVVCTARPPSRHFKRLKKMRMPLAIMAEHYLLHKAKDEQIA
jgi:hypothetical protein